jgi:hypothetical protein
MSGNFNFIFVNSTLQTLEKRCLILLSEGYAVAKSHENISIDWEEEDISKELIQSLESNKNRKKWKITIMPEYRIYKKDGLPAKQAPRIDFRFSSWMPEEWDYFVEAKNLIDIDSHKFGRKSKIPAKKLHKRYIETGIDNYISGHYPSNGCLIGYVLQGEIENIVTRLNKYLCDSNRVAEVLSPKSFELENLDYCYISTHNLLSIKHLMLDFT